MWLSVLACTHTHHTHTAGKGTHLVYSTVPTSNMTNLHSVQVLTSSTHYNLTRSCSGFRWFQRTFSISPSSFQTLMVDYKEISVPFHITMVTSGHTHL